MNSDFISNLSVHDSCVYIFVRNSQRHFYKIAESGICYLVFECKCVKFSYLFLSIRYLNTILPPLDIFVAFLCYFFLQGVLRKQYTALFVSLLQRCAPTQGFNNKFLCFSINSVICYTSLILELRGCSGTLLH